MEMPVGKKYLAFVKDRESRIRKLQPDCQSGNQRATTIAGTFSVNIERLF